MARQKNKTVKLQARHRSLAWGQKIVPELRVNGVWLEQNGFSRNGMSLAKAGDQVEITVNPSELIIKPAYVETLTDKLTN